MLLLQETNIDLLWRKMLSRLGLTVDVYMGDMRKVIKFLTFTVFFRFSFIKSDTILRVVAAAAAAKSLQLCPTLCDPIDGSPPGSPIPGILQARTLEWVAISLSNA